MHKTEVFFSFFLLQLFECIFFYSVISGQETQTLWDANFDLISKCGDILSVDIYYFRMALFRMDPARPVCLPNSNFSRTPKGVSYFGYHPASKRTHRANLSSHELRTFKANLYSQSLPWHLKVNSNNQQQKNKLKEQDFLVEDIYTKHTTY